MRQQIEISHFIDLRDSMCVSLFKLSFQFPRRGEKVREGNIKLPNMTELALSDERKPLIFPPFHHQSGGEEVAVGAQTADDVICKRGPPASGENCSDSQHVAK